MSTADINAKDRDFELWLKNAWDEDNGFGIFFSQPLILRLFMKNQEWYEGKVEWRERAGKRLACAFLNTYDAAHPLFRPYKYELLVYPPPPGGKLEKIEEGLITDQSCTALEKLPVDGGHSKIES